MKKKQLETVSKFISLVLRHKPEAAGIKLDGHGWADVEDLIRGVNASGHTLDKEVLETIVNTDEKQRYSYNQDKTKIRANQGHSIPVDVDLEEHMPPDVLYHGTADRFLEAILKQGLKPMSRQYVHLSRDMDTATKVGRRHGNPIVLRINARQMYEDGQKFYVSKNGVWLAKQVDRKYINQQNNG